MMFVSPHVASEDRVTYNVRSKGAYSEGSPEFVEWAGPEPVEWAGPEPVEWAGRRLLANSFFKAIKADLAPATVSGSGASGR